MDSNESSNLRCIEIFTDPCETPQHIVEEIRILCGAQPYAPSQQQIADFFSYKSSTAKKFCITVSLKGPNKTYQTQGAALWNCVVDQAELEYLIVHGDARGQGMGRQLMLLSQTLLKNIGAADLLLEVSPTNAAAFALYQSLGYAVIGTRQRYYSNGEDAAVMRLITY